MQETVSMYDLTKSTKLERAPRIYPDCRSAERFLLQLRLRWTALELNSEIFMKRHIYQVELGQQNGKPLIEPVRAKRIAPGFLGWVESEKPDQNPSTLQELHRLMNLYYQNTSSTGSPFETFIPQGGLALKTAGKYEFNGHEVAPPTTYLAAQVYKQPQNREHADLLEQYGWETDDLNGDLYHKERVYYLHDVRDTFLPPGMDFSVTFR